MRNATDVTLNTIPKLKKTSLRFAFVNVKELKMENASMLENNDELSEVKRRTDELIKRREEELRERRENGIVLNADDLENLPAHVKSITVNACEDYKKEVGLVSLQRVGDAEDWEHVLQLCEPSECGGTGEAEEHDGGRGRVPEQQQRLCVGGEELSVAV